MIINKIYFLAGSIGILLSAGSCYGSEDKIEERKKSGVIINIKSKKKIRQIRINPTLLLQLTK